MNTREVAEYLRIKERKVYDLVRKKRIPCTRVTGKWHFPKNLIDAWLAEGTDVPGSVERRVVLPPAVIAGSHDPLLEWSVRHSDCDLASLTGGSLDGLNKFVKGEAMVCALHVIDPETGGYNVPVIENLAVPDAVLIEWARREQGLVVAQGNPLGIMGLDDLPQRNARVIQRQDGAGSRILFDHLLSQNGGTLSDLKVLAEPARNETDLGQAISEGKADAGLAVRAAAQAFRLDFISLHVERCDLLVRRRDYFEPPVQKLLAFSRSPGFSSRADEMGGYDVGNTGRVVWNAA
ncbi:MAG: helix-turn-helix transcriptional regulator [Rhodospirillales bacterium]|nr:helix-turn-helix transcriptional regulator [Rhodospirillales bacterium]